MALLPLNFPPGIYRNGTEAQSKGRWYDCNLVRFYEGTIQPFGGWRIKSTSAMEGMGRSILSWKDNSLASWAAIGTHSHLYAMSRSGAISDITPYRATGTYSNNPLMVTNGSPLVTVSHVTHGLTEDDTIIISGATAVGGITPNGTFTVATVVDDDTFKYLFTSNATSDATGGGAAVAYIYEISPGLADATSGAGYGAQNYGEGTYGTPRPDSTAISDATVWSLDTFGQYLVACNADDGGIYQWTLDTSVRAAILPGAPTARAIFTTNEGMLVALGANGNPRDIAWSDQEDDTEWTSSALNQAGDEAIQTAGKLMMGRRIKGGHLLWTDLDVHLMRPTGDIFDYGFDKVGDNCGAISQNCAAVLNFGAVWMEKTGFWLYNGFAQALPCDVSDYVFSDINAQQVSKVTCFVNSDFGEVCWFYPSSSSTENDRFVTWNYLAFERGQNIWGIGSLVRLAGCDHGAHAYPLLVGDDGYVYEHEVGLDYDDAVPYVESGPTELGNGDKIMHVLGLVPDEKTEGDVTVTFKTKFYPNATETSYGPYSLSSPTDVRFSVRQFKLRYTGARSTDWRVGVPRVDVKMGGGR